MLNIHDNAIRLLAEGFASEFVEEVAGDERFHDLLMEMAEEFVSKNIPIVKSEDATDVAYELMIRCTTRQV